MSKQRELFEGIIDLSYRVRGLAGIVQNEAPEIPDDVLTEWNDSVNATINDLNYLKEDIIRFYNNERR